METIVAMTSDQFRIDIPVKFGKYDYVRTLGSGSFSVVALVVDRTTNAQYACKICSRQLLIERNIFDRFEREVRTMQSLRHPSLVGLEDVVFDSQLIYLVMEYCFNGELFQVIADQGRFEESVARRIFTQIVSGMIYIHSHDIAHRDLKPENILLDADMNAKITDFGLCHPVDTNTLLTTPCGSPFYAPPEIISNQPYDGKKSDVWSLGVVLYTIVTGALPWQESNQVQLFRQILDADYRIPRYLSPGLRDLISRLIRADPNDRPTMEEIAAHPWVADGMDEFGATGLGAARGAYGNGDAAARKAVSSMRRPLIVRPNIPNAIINTSSFGGSKVQSLIRRVPSSNSRRRSYAPHANEVQGSQ